MLNIRPSNLERTMLCAGSAVEEAKQPPKPENHFQAMGKKRHDGMALMVRIGGAEGAAKLAADEEWTAEDIRLTGEAYTLAHPYLSDPDFELFVEEPLDMEFMGIVAGERRPDLVGVNLKARVAFVLDWKFGEGEVTVPEKNWQLKSYAAAVEKKYRGQIDALDLVVVQPRAWREGDRVQNYTESVAEAQRDAVTIMNQVAMAETGVAIRVASDQACQYCAAKAVCPESKAKRAEAEQAKNEARRQLVASGTPVLVTKAPDMDLSLPVVVISQELVLQAQELYDEALSMRVYDSFTAEQAGVHAKKIRAVIKNVDDNRKVVKEPWLKVCKMIDDAPRNVIAQLSDGESHHQKEVRRFLSDEAVKEAAEAKRQEELARKRAEAEEARLKAERARKAENVQAHTETADKAEAEVKLLETQAPPVYVPRVTQVTGFKAAATVTMLVHDVAKVPEAWARQILVVDEKKVAALLKSGVLNENVVKGWATITRGTDAGRK